MLVTMFLYIFLTLLCHVGLVHLKTPSVIIVGAGPAGIAAASKLLENSITNLTILEAENRIGGRINTVSFGKTLVELGAEFCHGEKGNIVYELAKDYDILYKHYKVADEVIIYSNGSKIDFELKTEIQVIIQDDETLNYNKTGRSMEDYITHLYNVTLFAKYANDKDKIKVLKEALRYLEGTILAMEGAFSWSDISAEGRYEDSEGDQLLLWKGGVGYKTILEILMKSYPDPSQKLPIDDKIHLRTEVRTIFWDQNEQVQVLTSDNKTYTADYVIFTPSIGVLKQQKEEMFNPPFPASKVEAIEGIGFGAVMKVIVHFPKKWWNDEDYLFSFVWKSEDLIKTGVDFPGPTKDGLSWVSQFRAMNRVSNSNVWVMWITGDLIPEVEKLPLQSLKSGSQYILDKFLGRMYNVTEIDQIIASKWHSNKHFRGSYSYTKTGIYRSNREILAEPLENHSGKPVVLFAGEATNPKHYQSVHGAIETGFREAERIIELHREHN